MLKTTLISSTFLLSFVAQAEDLSSLFEGACIANGIDPDQCSCSVDYVIRQHSETAARYVGLDMSLRYGEAARILEDVGEDAVFAASSSFDKALNADCSPGRVARLKGEYNKSTSDAVSVSSSAGVAGSSQNASDKIQSVVVMTHDKPILDLTALDGEVFIDTSLSFKTTPNTSNLNTRDYIGFVPVLNLKGGLDTDQDGHADIFPGDAGYASMFVSHALPTRLYISNIQTGEHYLGEVRTIGGALLAPFVRFYRSQNTSQSFAGIGQLMQGNGSDLEAFQRAMSTPTHTYFVFDKENLGQTQHLKKKDSSSLGFRYDASNSNFDDAVFSFIVSN